MGLYDDTNFSDENYDDDEFDYDDNYDDYEADFLKGATVHLSVYAKKLDNARKLCFWTQKCKI